MQHQLCSFFPCCSLAVRQVSEAIVEHKIKSISNRSSIQLIQTSLGELHTIGCNYCINISSSFSTIPAATGCIAMSHSATINSFSLRLKIPLYLQFDNHFVNLSNSWTLLHLFECPHLVGYIFCFNAYGAYFFEQVYYMFFVVCKFVGVELLGNGRVSNF